MSVVTCPKCGALITPQLERCRQCGKFLHGTRMEGWLLSSLPGPLRKSPGTALLVIAIVVSYLGVAVIALPGSPLAFTGYTLRHVGATHGPSILLGEWWRIATSLFVHHDLLHVGFNLYALIIVGPVVEQLFDRKKMLLMYLLAGLGSMTVSHCWYVYLMGGPSILVTSPALRAVQTAENIAAITGIEPQLREGIHEAQAGEWEGRSDDDAHKAFTEIYGRWHGGDLDVRVPGGDSGRSILDRYVPVLDSLRSSHLTDPDGPDVVVVSHGAAIRLVAAVLGGVDGAFAADNHLDNTQTVALEPTAGGGWVCVRWGTYLAPFDGKGSRTADNPIS